MLKRYENTSHWLFVPIVTCFLALLPLSSLGYLAVRLVVCTSAIYLVFFWGERVATEMKYVFIFLAILYNPILPIYLYERTLWVAIDIIAAFIFLSQVKGVGAHSGNEIHQKHPQSSKGHQSDIGQYRTRLAHDAQWYARVIQPIDLALKDSGGPLSILRGDQGLKYWFIGYCAGFILYKDDPVAAFAFEENGIWIKKASWGRMKSDLSRVFVALLEAAQSHELEVLLEESIIFNSEWDDGYGYGIRDAEFWFESACISQSLSNRVWRV